MSPHDVRAGTEGEGGGSIAPTIHTRGPRSDTWSTPRPTALPRGRLGTKSTLGGLSGRALKISPPAGVRSQDHALRSEWQYRLSYSGREY